MSAQPQEPLLGPLRALDLTDDKGFLCGKILGDLGADVIKIEKPGGDPSRNIGPFYHDIPDPEKSLYWFAFNSNKRGITLDIETADGKEIFKKLVKGADFVMESFPPGYMDRLGLGYEALKQINPRIIMTSITPFGQTGPYKDYKASDIVVTAMSGYMYECGYIDGLPIRISFPQAYLHTSAQAAAGTLFAHYHREMTGEGQHVDVSAQEWLSYLSHSVDWYLTGELVTRLGPYWFTYRGEEIGRERHVWKCKDGYVSMAIMAGPMMGPGTRALVEWMDSEGMAPEFMKEIDWITFDFATTSQEFINQMEEATLNFLLQHTKQELFEESLRRRIILFPVTSIDDIVENPRIRGQLDARDYFLEVEHPELGTTITYPGAFYKSSETSWKMRRRAPLIGEHNEEIYERELGLSKEALSILKRGKVI